MPNKEAYCHGDHSRIGSKAPKLIPKLYSLGWRLKREGLFSTINRIWARLGSKIGWMFSANRTRSSLSATDLGEPLRLQLGEWVEIKSREEIERTLDNTGRCRGLGVMPEMWQLCGTRARVFKRVNNIVAESPDGSEVKAVRKMKDTVLLEGLFCDGVRLHCDRSCFFFWRECWLRRIP
jgi:hypothetical protein